MRPSRCHAERRSARQVQGDGRVRFESALPEGAAEKHIDESIVPMLTAGVDVSVTRAYDILRSKLVAILQAVEQKKLPPLTPTEFADWQAARIVVDTALAEADALRRMIESGKKRAVAKGVRLPRCSTCLRREVAFAVAAARRSAVRPRPPSWS
jgi:hypothetical protein